MVVWWVGAILGGISCSLFSRDVQKFFSLILGQLVTFFVNYFLTFSKLFLVFLKTFSGFIFLHVYTYSFFFHGLRGLGPRGGHHHNLRRVVSHVTPVTVA